MRSTHLTNRQQDERIEQAIADGERRYAQSFEDDFDDDRTEDRPFRRCPICGGLNPGDITHVRCM